MFAVMYLAEMVILRVVPVGAIALLNAFIVSRVTRITHDRRRRRQHLLLLTVEAAPDAAAAPTRLSPRPQRAPAVANCDADSGCVSRRASLDERNLQLTIILILVSTTYILFYLPILVHFVLFKMKRSRIVDVGFTFLDVFGNYAKALHVAGFAINFLLYTISGRVFREQLFSLLCRSRCRPATIGYARPAGGTTSTIVAPAKQQMSAV